MNSFFKILICTFALFISTGLCAEKYSDQFGTTFNFKVKDGKATITSFKGRTDQVRFPSQVTDKKGRKYPVSTLDLFSETQLFGYSYDTEVIQIEEGVANIDEECFSNFSKLYEVYLPMSLKYSGKNAFNNGRNISFPKLPLGAIAADLNSGQPFYPYITIADGGSSPINANVADNSPRAVEENNIEMRTKGVVGQSDVDMGIPYGGEAREKTFCLIIANEQYDSKDTPQVSWANTDGKIFYQYCRTTLGIPHENIRVVYNAGYLSMKKQLDWLQLVSKHYGADAKYIVYYAGHGVPDDNGKCYLIPRDGSIKDPSTGFPLSDIYGVLGEMSAQSALVLVDACFSGNDRHDIAMVDNVRGISRVQEQMVSGNVVAITAASNSQTALAYDEKAHGLFTYFLLKALKENRGNLTYGELYDYVKQNVSGKAVLLNDKEQTPSVNAGILGKTWREIKL